MDVVFACCIIHNHIIGVDPLDSIMSNGLRGSPLANERKSRRVQQSQREVQKKKIENGFKNGMIFVVKCGRIIMLWSDFILFILVGCVMDFFGFIFSKLLCDNYFCLSWTPPIHILY